MLNVKKLQAIRDKILGVTADPAKYGDLDSVVYLQQILDAVKGTDPLNIRGNLAEHIYLQKIRNAKLGVADGQFGSLSNSIYLQQIINACNGVAGNQFGSLSQNAYLDTWLTVESPAAPAVPWYLTGGIPAANVIAVYKSIGAASKAASSLSLNGNGNDLVENGAVTWAAGAGWSGWSDANFFGNGVGIPNLYNWSTNYSYVLRFSNLVMPAAWSEMIEAGTPGAEQVYVGSSNDGNIYIGNNGHIWNVPIVASGVAIFTPTKAYFNGVDLGAGAAGGGVYTGGAWRVGRGGNDFTFHTQKILALSIYNVDLALYDPVALSAAVAALP